MSFNPPIHKKVKQAEDDENHHLFTAVFSQVLIMKFVCLRCAVSSRRGFVLILKKSQFQNNALLNHKTLIYSIIWPSPSLFNFLGLFFNFIDVLFTNFEDSCGVSNVVFQPNTKSGDAMHPVYLDNLEYIDSPKANRIQYLRPNIL